MISPTLLLPLVAAAQVAATDPAPASYLNSLFECDVRRTTNYTTPGPESQGPTFTFKVWYGRIPGSGESGDKHGGIAVTVDPSDLLPDEYSYKNELPEDFYLRGDRGEWLRSLRIAPLADQSGAFDALIASLKQGAKPNSFEAADALHGVCRRRTMSWSQFRETEW